MNNWKKVALAAATLLTSITLSAETLTVYTALEADQIPKYLKSFNKAHKDIDVKIVRDSTGIIAAKLVAEGKNTQADVVWGTAASVLVQLDQKGMLAAYTPKGIENISQKYKDPANPPKWVGMDVWGSAVCFNTIEAKKHNLPLPKTWKDLTNPVYKGHVVMPNPASSGTGFLDVTAWLKLFGEDGGWKYMDSLHENIAQYTHSGSKPCKMAAKGEYPIGISFEYRAAKSKKQGAPIEIVFPTEGLGWDLESSAIINTTKKMDAAKKFMDWTVTKEANDMYAENFAVVAYKGASKKIDFIPANYEEMLIDNDFAWSAANRDSILKEWSKRYESKSEPKKK